jgi:Acetyltransferase (GNAT) domain
MSRVQQADISGASLAGASKPAAYEIKQLDTLEELIQSYRLRYEVYADLGHLRYPSASKLEIDAYDAWSIPFGAFDATSRAMIGSLRLVTQQLQPDFSGLIHRVLALFADDPSLAIRARAPRPHILPSIVSDNIDRALTAFNTENLVVSELSRSVVGRNSRGFGVARSLIELGLARAAFGGPAVLVGSCLPEHQPMFAKYGSMKLPQTGLEVFDSVGKIAIALVSRTDRLPEPTQSHVDEILRSMRTNAAGHAPRRMVTRAFHAD